MTQTDGRGDERRTRTGLDRAIEWLTGTRPSSADRHAAELIRKGRLGLLTNPSAVAADLSFAPEALIAAGAKVRVLFGPEHGVRGDVPDGEAIPSGTDAQTGLPVFSLYGPQRRPTTAMLKDLDALVVDIQDVGARFYTFGSSLSEVMEAADVAGLPVIILDRPNPIDGISVEGPTLEPAHRSFVGLYGIPIRHAATLGELGRLWHRFGAGDEPLVVGCRGWRRSDRWGPTRLQWTTPSPNMPTPETALVYPGTCLIEGTNLSEGRGTTRPFQWFGAPWVRSAALAEHLNQQGLPGCRFRPITFRPSLSKFQGQTCHGCELHVLDAREFRPVATGVAILAGIRRLFPDGFKWRTSGTTWPVDRLAGTAGVREATDAGRSWQEIAATWRSGEAAHRQALDAVRVA